MANFIFSKSRRNGIKTILTHRYQMLYEKKASELTNIVTHWEHTKIIAWGKNETKSFVLQFSFPYCKMLMCIEKSTWIGNDKLAAVPKNQVFLYAYRSLAWFYVEYCSVNKRWPCFGQSLQLQAGRQLRGSRGPSSPLENFSPSWKNVLDVVWNYCT